MKSTSRKIIFCILVVFLLMTFSIDNTGYPSIAFTVVHAESEVASETEAPSTPAISAIPEASPVPSSEPSKLAPSTESIPVDEVAADEAVALPIWISTIIGFISNLSIEHITLLSVVVTLVIFVSGKQSEVKYKRLEARRSEYAKFISLLQKSFDGGLKEDQETKKEFFDTGASLLLYGSKRVYKKYLFFREFTSNPLIDKSKYKVDELGIYIIADLLKSIRHEVGLTSFSELNTNEVLAFFVNNFGMNPISKMKLYRARYSLFMIKAEMFAIDRTKLLFAKKVYYYAIKPLFGIISLLWKYIFMVPLGRLLTKCFPKWANQFIQEKRMNKES